MHFAALFCVCLVALRFEFTATVLHKTSVDRKASENEITGMSSTLRKKRALPRLITFGTVVVRGIRARQKLLKGLTPVRRSKMTTYYEKRGGVQDMINDFKSVAPITARDFMRNGEIVGEIATVGDRTVAYDIGGTDRDPRITIAKTKFNGDTVVDIISYSKIFML